MRKKLIPFLSILFFTAGCYIYKPYTGNTDSTTNDASAAQSKSLRDPRSKTPVTGVSDSKNIPPKDQGQRLVGEDKKAENDERMETQRNGEGGKMEEENRRTKEQEVRRAKEEEIKRNKDIESAGNREKGKVVMDDGLIAPETVGISPVGDTAGDLKSKIQPNKYYKISVQERQYKIQADQWEGDTLVSHIIRKPKKVLKFHQNQIDEETLEERIFSKPYSDLITVGSYVAAGAAVLLLVL